MNLISCNYDCKWQKEGYCYLTDTKNAKHDGSCNCIYFEKNRENDSNFISSLNDEEHL